MWILTINIFSSKENIVYLKIVWVHPGLQCKNCACVGVFLYVCAHPMCSKLFPLPLFLCWGIPVLCIVMFLSLCDRYSSSQPKHTALWRHTLCQLQLPSEDVTSIKDEPRLRKSHAGPCSSAQTEARLSLRVYTVMNIDAKWMFARKHGGSGSHLRPTSLSSNQVHTCTALTIITESNFIKFALFLDWSFKSSTSSQEERVIKQEMGAVVPLWECVCC